MPAKRTASYGAQDPRSMGSMVLWRQQACRASFRNFFPILASYRNTNAHRPPRPKLGEQDLWRSQAMSLRSRRARSLVIASSLRCSRGTGRMVLASLSSTLLIANGEMALFLALNCKTSVRVAASAIGLDLGLSSACHQCLSCRQCKSASPLQRLSTKPLSARPGKR